MKPSQDEDSPGRRGSGYQPGGAAAGDVRRLGQCHAAIANMRVHSPASAAAGHGQAVAVAKMLARTEHVQTSGSRRVAGEKPPDPVPDNSVFCGQHVASLLKHVAVQQVRMDERVDGLAVLLAAGAELGDGEVVRLEEVGIGGVGRSERPADQTVTPAWG